MERAVPECAITDTNQRQARLTRSLADGSGHSDAEGDLNPDEEKQFRHAIRRDAALCRQRTQLTDELAHPRVQKLVARPAEETLPDPLSPLDVDLALVPEDVQRRLYDTFGLEVRYSRPRNELTLRVIVPGLFG
ncbi:hypothetical protein [Streptomyces sp. enrichment culture]|uniref:hypothetical protein n=1 Tax=Streptomyces sp. enrichment culture TaxID=1795815 RepID=UPI003F57209B